MAVLGQYGIERIAPAAAEITAAGANEDGWLADQRPLALHGGPEDLGNENGAHGDLASLSAISRCAMLQRRVKTRLNISRAATIMCCSCFDRVAATGLARLEPARRLCTGSMGLKTVDWRRYFSQRAASPTPATPIEVLAQGFWNNPLGLRASVRHATFKNLLVCRLPTVLESCSAQTGPPS
jgi:hypothetical protein